MKKSKKTKQSLVQQGELTNIRGERGEKIAYLALTDYAGGSKPLIRPAFLGEKLPTLDYYVELEVALTKPLPPVESVVPSVVCFEPSPLRFPVALEVEDAISAELNTRPFVGECGRLPVQMFDVEGIERFGDLFGLPSEWELLLDAIGKRSRSPHLRYKPLARASGIMAAGEHSGSSALPKLVFAAQKMSSKRWRELTPRSRIANPKMP